MAKKEINKILAYQNPANVFADNFYAWSGGFDQPIWTPLRILQVFTDPKSLAIGTTLFVSIFSIPGWGVIVGSTVIFIGICFSILYLVIDNIKKQNNMKYADLRHIIKHLHEAHSLKVAYKNLLKSYSELTGKSESRLEKRNIGELIKEINELYSIKIIQEVEKFTQAATAFENELNRNFQNLLQIDLMSDSNFPNPLKVKLNQKNYRLELRGDINIPENIAGAPPKTAAQMLEAFKNRKGMQIFIHVWDVLGLNSMAYWVVWMVPFFLMGVGAISANMSFVVPVVLLGISAAVSLVYAGLIVYNRFYRKGNPSEKEIEIANEFQNKLKLEIERFAVSQNLNPLTNRLLTAGTASRRSQDLYHDEIKRKIDDTKEKIPNHIPLEENRAKKLYKTIIKIGSAFVTGYMISSFLAWPIMDGIDLIFTQALAMNLFSGMIGIIIASLCFSLIGATLYAINAGLKHRDSENEKTLKLSEENYKNFIKREREYLVILKYLEAKPKTNQDAVDAIKNIKNAEKLHECFDNHMKDMNGHTDHDPRSFLKKIGHRFKEMLNGAGSGIFMIRSLFLPNTVFGLIFFATPGIGPGIAVMCTAICFGLTVAIWQGVAYHYRKKEMREKAFIDSVAVKSEIVERKIILLHEIDRQHFNVLFKQQPPDGSIPNNTSSTPMQSNSNNQIISKVVHK